MASDRLDEAEFFLNSLEETRGEGPEFRYFFAATVNALRSVSLVLQKDLRRQFGGEFDDWWEEGKARVPDALEYGLLQQVRNVIQKEGNRLPLAVVRVRVDDPIVEAVEVRWEAVSGLDGWMSTTLSLREGWEESGSTDAAPLSLQQHLREVTAAALRRNADVSFRGFAYSTETEPMPFEDLVARLRDHTTEHRAIVEEAERKFPQASIWEGGGEPIGGDQGPS